MRKLILFTLIYAAYLGAQQGTLVRSYAVSQLPTAASSSGVTVLVVNGVSATDCTVGGGLYAVPCKSSGTAWIAQSIGSGGGAAGGTNKQTANYTLISSDAGKLVSMNGSSLTVTMPAAPPSATWYVSIQNLASTALTVARNGLTINGGTANITLQQYQGIVCYTDGANYFCSVPDVAGSGVTLTPAANGVTIAATGGGGGDTITSPHGSIAVGGTSTNTTIDVVTGGSGALDCVTNPYCDVVTALVPLKANANVFTGATKFGQGSTANSGANFSSQATAFEGSYWNGTAAANDDWSWQDVLGTGTNPTTTFTLAHTGSSGTAAVSIPFPITVASCTGCGGGSGGSPGPPDASPQIRTNSTTFGGVATVLYTKALAGSTLGAQLATCFADLASTGGTCDTSGTTNYQINSDVFVGVTAQITVIQDVGFWLPSVSMTIPSNFTFIPKQGALWRPSVNAFISIYASERAGANQQIVDSPLASGSHVVFFNTENGISPVWHGVTCTLRTTGIDDSVALQQTIDNTPDFGTIRYPGGCGVKITAAMNYFGRVGIKTFGDGWGPSIGQGNGNAGNPGGYGVAFGWFGAVGGTMLKVNYSDHLYFGNFSLFCSGFQSGYGSSQGCNTFIATDEIPPPPTGGINTDNTFQNIYMSNAVSNPSLIGVALSVTSPNNVEQQVFDNVVITCGSNGTNANTGIGWYVGNSSNAVVETLTGSTINGCTTATRVDNGKAVTIERNDFEFNKTDLYVGAGGVQGLDYGFNTSEFTGTPSVKILSGNPTLHDNVFYWDTTVAAGWVAMEIDASESPVTLANNYWEPISGIIAIGGSAVGTICNFTNNAWPDTPPSLPALCSFADDNNGLFKTIVASHFNFSNSANGAIFSPLFNLHSNAAQAIIASLTPGKAIIGQLGDPLATYTDAVTPASMTGQAISMNVFEGGKFSAFNAGVIYPELNSMVVNGVLPASGGSGTTYTDYATAKINGINLGSVVSGQVANAYGEIITAPTGAAYNAAAKIKSGHLAYSDTIPTTTSTGCTIGTNSTDSAGYLTLSTGATSCVVTFAHPFNAGVCTANASVNTILPTVGAPLTTSMTVGVTYTSGSPTVTWGCSDLKP